MRRIEDVDEARAMLKKVTDASRKTVFLGGAGVSTASGIPDFRSVDGLYHQKFAYPPEEMLSHTFWRTHPEEFYDFYRDRMIALGANPNAAHYKLAALEREGKLSSVLTQNIDGLHTLAGSKNVLELHGSVHRNICQGCGHVYPAEWIVKTKGVPHCDRCGAVVKPDVVLYEEALDEDLLQRAAAEVAGADTLIIGGTSLVVWPVAGLVQLFHGRHLVIVNLQPTPSDGAADIVINADIAKAFEF